MRLKADEVDSIKESVNQIFGQKVSVWLFGSRADDTKKGGDIDLYLEVPSKTYSSMQKNRLWATLIQKLGDQKIDIVINRLGLSNNLPIYDVAKRTGVKL